MEVVGRHALLFDDDATSAFVNSREALVEWNSLLIDRYDVRHLLPSLPPLPPKKRRLQESDLDQIRFEDLPPPSPPQENNGANAGEGGIYHAVCFAYGNTDSSIETKDSDVCGFIPHFPVPDSLLQSLPPTEKLHQIIARTALFVSEHGGQSEIVLRVKQGNNPTFGFLMPDHHLHAYFRFLVDHPEVLKSGDDTKTSKFENAGLEQNQTDVAGEALSLLGSVYGCGEDEDGALPIVSESKDEPVDTINATSATLNLGLDQAVSSGHSTVVDIGRPKNSVPISKEHDSLSKKIHSAGVVASSKFSKKKEGNVLESLPGSDKRVSTLSSASMIEPLILEPPSEIKRMIDKIVEFVLKNGKEFEAVLIEQDRTNGRFPFLLPTNQYHAYYLRRIQKAQESKEAGRSSTSHKHDSVGHVSCKGSVSKDRDALLKESAACHDLPYDLERKEKFKMVISGSKKDAPELPPKSAQQQCGMSVDAAAAILQAATRGLRNPRVQMPTKTNLPDSVQGSDIEGRSNSSLGSLPLSSQIRRSTSKPVSEGEPSERIPVELSKLVGLSKESSGTTDVSVAKAIAKTAALAAASEADSSEASLTKEQKQKAERLKRAKMFAAMIKTGAVPQKNDLLPRLSAEPPVPMISGLAGSGYKNEMMDGSSKVPSSSNISDTVVVDARSGEREGSCAPVVDKSDKMEKCSKMDSGDEHNERGSRKRHHSRSRRMDDEDDDEERGSRKRHHSRSRRVDDEDDDEERGSRKRHHSRSRRVDEDEDDDEERGSRKRHHSRSRRVDDEDDDEERGSRKRYHSRSRRVDDDEERGSRKRHHSTSRRVDDEDDDEERGSRKRPHSRSRRVDDGDEEDDDEERGSRKIHHSRSRRVDDGDDDDEERSHKHFRNNHHSRRSSHHSKSERRHKKGHSSSKDGESRHSHKYRSSSEDGEYHRSPSYNQKVSHSESKNESDTENGDKLLHGSNTLVAKKVDGETSADLINDRWEGSKPSNEAQPSDELRAKVRAMLLATL